jgi:hypothetical protein
MKNFYTLDFDSCIEENLLKSFLPMSNSWHLQSLTLDRFKNSNILEYFKKINFIPYDSVNFFTGPGHQSTRIHSDNGPTCNITYALNYIWGSDKNSSYMNWYSINENALRKVNKTSTDKFFYWYNEHDSVEIERMNDTYHRLILVRVDTPHKIVNNSDNYRYCLSFRGQPVETWDNILKHFRSFIIE